MLPDNAARDGAADRAQHRDTRSPPDTLLFLPVRMLIEFAQYGRRGT